MLADRTRNRLWRELADGRTVRDGAHFPELRPGRVTAAGTRRWTGLDEEWADPAWDDEPS